MMQPRVLARIGVLLALTMAPAAAAQAQVLPPLPPPVGQPPPPSGSPPQQQQPPQNHSSPPGPISPAPGSVSEAVDVAHTGFFADDQLVPPLVPRWKVNIDSARALAAEGR